MKELKLGVEGKEKTFYVFEEANEVTTARWAEIQKYVTAIDWGTTAGELAKHLFRYEQSFNEAKMNECYLSLVDMRRGAVAIAEGANYFELIFALIVVDKQEKDTPENYREHISESYLTEKIERFRKLGLTNAQVTETIKNFILASPKNFPLGFLKTLEGLIRWLHLNYEKTS
jgi:hypothetical protein